MKSSPNSGQNEPQSFEISQWFSSVLNRIDSIQYHQKYLIKWRNLALKLKRTKRLARVKYVHSKYRQKKCSRSSKSNWLLFYSKLWHRKKKKLFNIARNQLLDAKQKAEDLRRAKKILMIPETDSEDNDDDNSNSNSDPDSNQSKLFNNNQYDDLSPNARKWISMSQRFLSQTKYNELLQAYQDYLNDLKFQKIERKDLWQQMSHILIWNIKKKRIKICCRNLKRARENWNFLYSNCVLASKLKHIRDAHSLWNSLSLKTGSQIRRCWNRFYFSLKFKQNILRICRESSALSTLTNFFRYIILIRRSAAVANYFPIRYVASIRSMVKKSTYDSAEKIRKFTSMKVVHDNDTFAFNWSNCIAEAFSNVATHQVGPPVSIDQRKVKIKQKQKVNKKVTNNNNLNDKVTVQTVQVKANPDSQQNNEQEYPTKIIKITRNFDPNEEESDREVLPYLSESNGSSDDGSDKPNISVIQNRKYKSNTTSIADNHNRKNDQMIIITSQTEKPKSTKDILIEINPSGSQSTGSVEEYVNNENTSDNSNNNTNQVKPNDTNLPASQEVKPTKKKKKKQKELYAPIVIPKGRKTLSPIKKKRVRKQFDEETNNPTISDILNIVGIDSSLELLDEGSVSDVSSTDINFRFDDDSSEPIAEPFKDLVVDLININTSEEEEERRIRQSLLEASQASSNPPINEEEDQKLPKLKEDKKIDLLSPSQKEIVNDELISASPSYNSNSESTKEKDFNENKSNGNEIDQLVIEEEEEDDDVIQGTSVKDEKADLFDDIEKKKEEEDLAGFIIEEEEEDKSCEFNFESEKNDDKISKKTSLHSSSLNEQKSVQGPSDSYISDRDVDAAMHEYSSDEATK